MFEIVEKYNFWNNEEIKIGFQRESYINKINSYLDNNLVKIIIGQRRVGKSYLLRQIINYLIHIKKINPKNILHINMDIYDFNFIKNAGDFQKIISEYQKKLNPQGKIYIFIDEVQEIEEWEKIVNSLSQDYKDSFEVFITGSNSNLLSNELSTYLSGRYILIEVYPFDYKEYINYNKLVPGKESFLKYLKYGGLPETMHLDDDELKRNYIESLKDSILFKDIVQRNRLRDSYLLERLIYFLIDNSGSMFSINSVVNYLISSKIKTNNETIGNYLKFIEETFFIHGLERFDIKGKEILSHEKKYYLNDTGFKYFLTSSFNFNLGRFLENAIYLNLIKNGHKVFIGKIKDKEIDFIAEINGIKKYIQVTYLLSDQEIINREFGNLRLIEDNYEKIVVSLDEVDFGNNDGISHKKAWDFCLV